MEILDNQNYRKNEKQFKHGNTGQIEVRTQFFTGKYDEFIKNIENNNASTLIGTLQDCYKFMSLNPQFIPCSQKLINASNELEPHETLNKFLNN